MHTGSPPFFASLPSFPPGRRWLGPVALALLCWALGALPADAQQLNRVDDDVLRQARTDVHGDDLTGKDGPLSSVGLELALLYREHQRFEREGGAGPFESKALTRVPVQDGYVTVDVVARNGTSALESDLRRLGGRDIASFRHLVSARVPIDRISELAALSSLRGARLARAAKPQRTESGPASKENDAASPSPLVGATDSQGDEAMNADDVRSNFGVDGAGTTVGVLSDSYDNSNVASTTAADDIASGDLPPSDRITVLDDEITGIDEGRAMMQLIYDVAPGTDLSFHTAFKGQANFAQGILELANAGADVIVDDIFYFAEPFYQDGVIAQAVDQAAAQGVPYFSSAGNAARQSYASTSFNTVTVNQNDDTPVYDFDPSSATDTLQQVTIPVVGSPDLAPTVSFQWDDPFFSLTGDPNFAADADLDIYLLDKTASDTLASSTIDNTITGDPVEVFTFFNEGNIDADGDGTADETFQIKIEKAGGSDPGRIKYFWSGVMTVEEFATDSPTSVGHSIASGGAGVAAAFYQDTPAFGTTPPEPEGFTSLGGVPILFEDNGPRQSPEVRNQPRFTAPDGTNTTFFGGDSEGDGFPNFFGTSAAAPHAAAVAALQLQANPGQTPSEIYNGLANGAVDMEASGFDFLTGAGLIDASQTITSTAGEPNIEVEPTADVDFGDRFFDQSAGALFATPSVTVQVRNVGTAPLEITNTTLTGNAFTVSSGGIPSGTLAEDGEETATITFDPGSTGSYSESYEIESDDPDASTVTRGLAGNALLPPVADISASSLFEAVETGNTATQTLSVSNTGDNPLEYDVFAEALGLGPFSPSDVAAPPSGQSTAKTNAAPSSPTVKALSAPETQAHDPPFDESDFIYSLDDGSNEGALGIGANADVFWLNAFEAQEGGTTITAISSAFGSSQSVGSNVEFLLYEDPNDDGNPTDANLLQTVSTTMEVSGGGNFQIEPIPPTQVEGVFFVAALVPSTPNFPAPLDESSNQGASWFASAEAGTFDPSDLSGSDTQSAPSPVAGGGFPGNWLLRAQGAYAAFEPVSGTVNAGNASQVDITFDGTSLETGRYQANAAVTSNDPETPRIDVPFTFFVADAVGEAALSSSTTSATFDDTGVAADLSGVSGSGTVTAMRFDDSPTNVSLSSGESVSEYRWFIRQDGDLTFDAQSEIRFQRADIPGPGFDATNADDVTVYRRSSFGTGAFSDLASTFDDGGTPDDLSDDAIVASGATEFSEFVFSSTSAPLPVEIASLDATRDGEDVVLSWKTASETNNAGFRLERTTQNEAGWTEVGTLIEGSGTTTEAQTYRHRVEDLSPNTYRFRLKSVSTDGTTSVGPTTTVEVQMTDAYAVSSVRPNPTSTRGRLDVQVREKQDVRVVLYNVLGQEVRTLHDGPLAANTPRTVTVDGSSLASGVYFVRVQGETFQTTRKVTLAQ